MGWILSLIFVWSRVTFANWGNVFFDSREYLSRWSNSNFLVALTTGHEPLHDGYILTFWPIFQLAKLAGLDDARVVVMAQIGLALATMWFFYGVVKILFDRRVAFNSTLAMAAIPLYWITNGAVMMETTYLFYWMGSLYFLLSFLENSRQVFFKLFLSGLFWVMAFLTHTVVIMWIPLFVYICWYRNRKRFLWAIGWGGVALTLASLINAEFLARAFNTDMGQGFYHLYLSKFGEHADFQLDLTSILRYFRNFIVPLVYNNTALVVIVGFAGLVSLFKKDNAKFVLLSLWIAPAFVTNQWWDSLFYGRHALIASFALVIICAYYLRGRYFQLFFVYLAACSIPVMSFMLKPVPYLVGAEAIGNLPSGGIVIETHFARPQVDGLYQGKIIFVDEPGSSPSDMVLQIDNALSLGQPVFITEQALGEPYGLFNGPYLHSLTLSYRNDRVLRWMSGKYSFVMVNEIDRENNLAIYKMSSGEDVLPAVLDLRISPRTLSYHDPIMRGWRLLENVLGIKTN